MKVILVLSLVAGILTFYSNKTGYKAPELMANKITTSIMEPVDFKTQLLPILQKNCNPCHFPGGKMYGKMPFDSSKTIIDHGEGILRRFKDENEKALLSRYLEENKQVTK